MRTSELLNAIAAYLESPNNEAILLAEGDAETLKMVAESCVEAAAILRKTAEQVDVLEPVEPSAITPETVEGLAMLAGALDASGDVELRKQASVIDELLLTIAAKDAYAMRKDLLDNRLVDLKKRYEGNAAMLKEIGRVDSIEKAIKESKMTEEVKINEVGLSTRTCKKHPGSQMARIGQDLWQCDLDKEVVDYSKDGSVANQTQNSLNFSTHTIFDSREGRLGYVK